MAFTPDKMNVIPNHFSTGGQTARNRYIKPEAIKELEALADAEARRRHPTMPHLAPRRFRDDTANALTGCITTYLRLKGAFCSRINNTGIFDKRLNRYRCSTSRKGLPDVLATYKGKSLMIEVKTGRDRLSEHQERIRMEQKSSGGLYFVAHSFSEFKTWFDDIEASGDAFRQEGNSTIPG